MRAAVAYKVHAGEYHQLSPPVAVLDEVTTFVFPFYTRRPQFYFRSIYALHIRFANTLPHKLA